MFERLTNRTEGGIAYTKIPANPSNIIDVGECYTGRVVDRIAAYEDTGLTPEQIQVLLAEKETTLNGTYISMEAHNREVKKLKAEIGYEQDRIDCRNTICNANREGMYRKCAELESQIEALTADKDEQAGRIMRMENMLYQAKDMLQMGVDYLNHDKPFDPLGSMKIAIKAIDALLGGKEDV